MFSGERLGKEKKKKRRRRERDTIIVLNVEIELDPVNDREVMVCAAAVESVVEKEASECA